MWKQELMQRLWRNALGPAPPSLLSLFPSDSPQDHLARDGTAQTEDIGSPKSIINQEMSLQT